MKLSIMPFAWWRVRFSGMQNGCLSLSAAGATGSKPPRISLGIASQDDREEIYGIRHSVYGEELGQHAVNRAGRLSDALDDWNIYLTAKVDGAIAGFISVTPAGCPSYSIDKYVPRPSWPFPFDNALFEIRLLTVIKSRRGSDCAFLLMYAALRWIEA